MTRVIPERVEMDMYGIVRCAECGAPVGTRRPLSPKQTAVLAFIVAYIAEYTWPPTLLEITKHMGWKNQSNAHAHLVELERKGWIRRGYKTFRDITIIAEEKSA